jgi:hypothetical protein
MPQLNLCDLANVFCASWINPKTCLSRIINDRLVIMVPPTEENPGLLTCEPVTDQDKEELKDEDLVNQTVTRHGRLFWDRGMFSAAKETNHA